MKFGDKNTSYFYTATIIKRKYNKIESLNLNGQWIKDNARLKKIAREFYINLYSKEGIASTNCSWPNLFFKLNDSCAIDLAKEISNEEVKKATFDTSLYKAPGPDGLQPVFYQS